MNTLLYNVYDAMKANRRGRGPSMAITFALLPLLLVPATLHAQSFTKVTTGDLVIDGGNSWGASAADYDRDGNLDIFVTNNGVNFLYRSAGAGTFTKITTGEIVTDSADSRGSSWGDYDNDGDLDLYVANNGSNNYLYQNKGDRTFTKITESVLGNEVYGSRGCSWGDYDNDGHLDMFVSNGTGNNYLYHNNGDGTFAKIESGAVVTDGGFSIGCNWVDCNNDGYLDLYVANFGEVNFLYQNNGDGTFTRITSGEIVSDVASSTGANWGDFDHDGDWDVFVANAGNQNNALYINDGPPNYTFTKSTSLGVEGDGGDSYAGSWIDYDNDGDLDLFVGNRLGQNEFLYENIGPPAYIFLFNSTSVLTNEGGNTYGSVWGDFDNDGDQDLLVCNQAENNSLYLNDGNANHWITIECVGVASNTSAIGARVRVKATVQGSPRWQVQEVSGQTTYYSQNSLEVEFGLAEATKVDSIVIDWPNPPGSSDTLINAGVDQFVIVKQSIATPPVAEALTDHITSALRATVTNEGNIGSLNNFVGIGPGSGFQFNPAQAAGQRLFEGALMIGADSMRVSDAARDETQVLDADFRFRSNLNSTQTNTAQIVTTSFDDSLAEAPIGVFVSQKTVSIDSTGVNSILIFELDIENASGRALLNLFVGAFFDWDVAPTANDRGRVIVDSTNTIAGVNNGQPFRFELMEMHAGENPNAWVGIVPLSESHFRGRRITISPDEVYPPHLTNADKWRYMNFNRSTNANGDGEAPQDHAMIFGLGPFEAEANASVRIGFAMVAGASLADFVGAGRAAQRLWVELLGNSMTISPTVSVSEPTAASPTVFELEQNYPNPFNPATNIRYSLPQAQHVQLTILDALGREVARLVDGIQPAGSFEVTWQARESPSGIYFYKLEARDATVNPRSNFSQVRKLVLLK